MPKGFLEFLFVSPSDMAAMQGDLMADAVIVNQGVSACAALDDLTRAGWATWFSNLQVFTSQVPVLLFPTSSNEVLTTPARGEQLNALKAELTSWRQRLSAKCTLAGPGLQSGNDDTPNPWIVPLEYAAIATGVVGVAIIVSRITALLPTYRERASVRQARRLPPAARRSSGKRRAHR